MGGGHDDHLESAEGCHTERGGECYNEDQAKTLKIIAIFAILAASLLGIALPLIGKKMRFLSPRGRTFVVAKIFAAGVILATAFIHMLPEAAAKLDSPCLPKHPWGAFPWWSFFCMVSIIFTHMVEFASTAYYKGEAAKRAQDQQRAVAPAHAVEDVETPSASSSSTSTTTPEAKPYVYHNSPPPANVVALTPPLTREHGDWSGTHGHLHGRPAESESEGLQRIRDYVVAQVLEVGILSHSILIGLAIGVSFVPCDIRPLMVAIVFHQFFEGLALGGCILQAGFRTRTYISMAAGFALTTPVGIILGIVISASYSPVSVTSLLTEGILDSISAGILIYMSFVNIIASEFLTERMLADRGLQIMSYVALFLGVGTLSIIGIWA